MVISLDAVPLDLQTPHSFPLVFFLSRHFHLDRASRGKRHNPLHHM